MNAGDIIAAAQVIHTTVSKVKDNKEELKRLSSRIQFILEALEESRSRNVIRDDEYNDSLTTISELITRTHRLTRRMLKRSLGDRTWNAGEITNELRRLNEDAHTFLNVHTVKTLDLVQTAQHQHQQYMTSSIEEVIAKITELDLAFSSFKPGAKPMVQPQVLMTTATASMQKLGNSSSSAFGQSPTRGAGSRLTRAVATEDQTQRGHPEPSREEIAVATPPAISIERLKAGTVIPLAINGLRKPFSNEKCDQVVLELPGRFKKYQIIDAIREAGYEPPVGLAEEDFKILVTENESVYDAMEPGGLQISMNEPLLWWFNKYEEYHGVDSAIPMKTDVSWTREQLQVGSLTIRCHRTFRVPDGRDVSLLPPDCGSFPFFPVAALGSKVPLEVKRRGGFIMPMFRREALWVSFRTASESENPAVKVSVGGVNVISGVATSERTPLNPNVPQDYVVAGKQQWIDGIVVGPNVVRQFVVSQLNQGYTVEEQVTGEAKVGGLQFDIYPRRKIPPGRFTSPKSYNRLYVTFAPQDLGIFSGTHLGYEGTAIRRDPELWTLLDYAKRTSSMPSLTAQYPISAEERLRLEQEAAKPRWRGLMLGVGSPRSNGLLGIAAGGKIEQKIYSDTNSLRVYNENLGRRIFVHIVTAELWEELTCILPPFTPITREMYQKHNLPYFKVYDDYVPGITTTSEALARVLSVAEVDAQKKRSEDSTTTAAQSQIIDPDLPPGCFQHPTAPTFCILRPCGHPVCVACFGGTITSGNKCSCGSSITRFIGVKQPIPQIGAPLPAETAGGDETEQTWELPDIEKLSMQAHDRGTVTIIHLEEDRVAPLQRSYAGPTDWV